MTYNNSNSNKWAWRRKAFLKAKHDNREIRGKHGYYKGEQIPLMVVRKGYQGNFSGYSRKKCDHLAKRWVTDESQVYKGRYPYLEYGWFHNPRNIRKKTWDQREIEDHHLRP